MPKKGYWSEHKFSRISMEKEVKDYKAAVLKELIEKCDKLPRKKDPEKYRKMCKALIAALFLTGGRIQEVLLLKKDNFDFDESEARKNNAFLVKNMEVYKSHSQKKAVSLTRTFPIWYDEPLVPYLTDWLDVIDKYLFSTQRRTTMSPSTAFVIVRQAGELLDRPKHINTMWFRKQREQYLVKVRGFSAYDLQAYFKFRTTPKISRHRKDWQNLLYVTQKPNDESLVEVALNPEELRKLADKKPCIFFPADVWEKLTEIEKSDFSDAAKCLLAGLATPAALVIWRGSEASIKNYYRRVTGKEPDERAVWRGMTRELKKKAQELGIKDNFVSFLDSFHRLCFRNDVYFEQKSRIRHSSRKDIGG